MKIDRDKQLDQLIGRALREYPLEPVPERLKARIMGQIVRPVVVARFRIPWVDFALSGALALMIGFALNFIQGVVRSPYWSARFRIGLILFWQDVRYFILHNKASLTAVLLSAGVVLSLLAVLASVYRRYTLNTRGLPA